MGEPIPEDTGKDVCVCGDYRDQHEPNGGPCKLNGLGHGTPGFRCERFKLHAPKERTEP